MTPEEQKYYDNYLDLFAKEGWKQFLEDVLKESEKLTIEKAETLEHLYFFKGQVYVLNNLMNFEEMIRFTLESIEQQDD